MKILQVTNIVSPHQIPLSQELYKMVGKDNFLFAAMDEIDEERLKNGWRKSYSEDWIVYPNNNSIDEERFNQFWQEADIVLCGERLISKMQQRVDNNKICFYMSERWWKPPLGILRLIHPQYLKMFLNFRRLSRSEYFHYLPIGNFAANDMKLVTSMQKRIWQWGYFTKNYNLKRNYISNIVDNKINILWVGRMIKCKRLDLLIKSLYMLKKEDYSFKLTLIGEGPERKKLEKLAIKLLDSTHFEIKGFADIEDIPYIMASHDIYVLPSNGYEGWGAVINEAMSVGCAVICSDRAGSGSFLIDHGKNGLLFRSGSKKSLYKSLKKLFDNKFLIKELGANAMLTISETWQPSVAAENLILLASSLLEKNEKILNIKGPLQKII